MGHGADDYPKSMHNSDVRNRRREMLKLPHMLALTEYVEQLRRRGRGDVPDFDPLDGGINARTLFLFEKPGPMTDAGREGGRHGSGFISRNNDDETAAATSDFMLRAGIPRTDTIIWNVIPWWNGTRKITNEELKSGVCCVKELIDLLPGLVSVVFVGRRAAKARPLFNEARYALFESAHPSPLVHARWKDKWEAIPTEWARTSSPNPDPSSARR
jgi:hypothetical protein